MDVLERLHRGWHFCVFADTVVDWVVVTVLPVLYPLNSQLSSTVLYW